MPFFRFFYYLCGMKPNRITIEQLCRNGRTRVLSYHGKLVVSDHIAQEYLFEEPCRLDALMILVCLHGRLSYEVNLQRYEVNESSILVNLPQNIIQFRGSDNLQAYVVLVDTDLLNSLSHELLQQAKGFLPLKQHYGASVRKERIAPLLPFLDLFKHNLMNDTIETEDIVKSLLQAFLLSILMLMREHRMQMQPAHLGATRGSRQLFERFMESVSVYHQRERMVQFYADKLCVTPKYLSMAVKEYSGKSPSDWICDYVIAEAKSLLHYQQMPVQEVAFHLNFPTQSAFGKFFKQKTGVSPREYMTSGFTH